MEQETITTAIDFFQKIKDEGIIKIKFTKQNGEERIMLATLDFNRIPKRDYPKGDLRLDKIIKLLFTNKIARVYDLEKSGWRSIPYDRVDYVQTKDNVIYKVRIK